MGRGRAPCCDKTKVKKGPWNAAEDAKLTAFILNHGHSNWRTLPKQAGLVRCGKSCRLRWINYLRPDVKRGNFTPQEEQTIINLHNCLGNKWSKIASYLAGRTDNEIKNVWNTHLKKRVIINNKSTQPQTTSSTNCSSIITSSSADHDIEKPSDDTNDPKQTSIISDSPTSYSTSNSNWGDVNKPNESLLGRSDDGKIEIPLEYDSSTDFWELFDSLEYNYTNLTSPEEKCDMSGIEEGSKWFRLLENELLGLTSDGDNDIDYVTKDQNTVPTTNDDLPYEEMHLEPAGIIGPGLMDYFPIWPSSPQNLGI